MSSTDIIIDAAAILKDYRGETMRDENGVAWTISTAVSIILTASRSTEQLGSHKAYILAKKFYKDDKVNLDKIDYDSLIQFLQSERNWPIGMMGALIEELIEQKSAQG